MWMPAAPTKACAESFFSPTFPIPTLLLLAMSSRRTRAIPIPQSRSSRRQPGEPSFPGPGVDPLAVPQTQPSFPTRSRSSHVHHGLGEPSSLLFQMDPDPPAYSYTTQNAPSFLYDPPRFTRSHSSRGTHCCRRCGQPYNPMHASNSRTQDLCERCRGQAAQHASTHHRPNPALAVEYIPAWHRSDALDDALQTSYSECLPLPVTHPRSDARHRQRRPPATCALLPAAARGRDCACAAQADGSQSE
ncbi:hypothetical protein BC628DRAFT_648190 [Trametes gibbosa]|nr:hypothetical protein BC628DRAFT_648190 [Trametes gibbosa]